MVAAFLKEVGVTLQRKFRKQPATHALPAETKAITVFIQPDAQSWWAVWVMWETCGCTRDSLLSSWRQTTYGKLSSYPLPGTVGVWDKTTAQERFGGIFLFLPGQHVVLLNGSASRDIISSFNCPSRRQLLHVCLPPSEWWPVGSFWMKGSNSTAQQNVLWFSSWSANSMAENAWQSCVSTSKTLIGKQKFKWPFKFLNNLEGWLQEGG